jgi:uncharacterized lipoprotein
VVKQTPEQLWPQLKQFWEDSGFTLAQELPAAGIMETEWNENRAKIPQDFIRNTWARCSTRCIRAASATSSAPVSSAAPTVPARSTSATAACRKSPPAREGNHQVDAASNDPGLEAEFLARLLNKLGNGGEQLAQAKTAVDGAIVQPQHASLVGAVPTAPYRWMRASTAPGAVSAWRWTAPASPWKTATVPRAFTSCATSTMHRKPRLLQQAVQLGLVGRGG